VAVNEYIERIKELKFHLNAVVDNRFGDAIMEAKICDEQLLAGKFDIKTLEKEKPLYGVPITIKECCALKGTNNSYSKINSNSQSESKISIIQSFNEIINDIFLKK